MWRNNLEFKSLKWRDLCKKINKINSVKFSTLGEILCAKNLEAVECNSKDGDRSKEQVNILE